MAGMHGGVRLLRPPDLVNRVGSRASSRAESPMDIISDARDFVAGATGTPLPRRTSSDRKPSLDEFKMPFRSERRPGSRTSDCASRNASGSPERSTVKRLPSLTSLEGCRPPLLGADHGKDKHREGVDSRGSDTGQTGSSRGSSRTRRHRKHVGEASSAPGSRGEQVSEPLTPVTIPEGPKTEPQRGKHSHKPLLSEWFVQDKRDLPADWGADMRGSSSSDRRRISGSSSAPQLGLGGGVHSSRRPPLEPRGKHRVAKDVLGRPESSSKLGDAALTDGLGLDKQKFTWQRGNKSRALDESEGSPPLPGQVAHAGGYPIAVNSARSSTSALRLPLPKPTAHREVESSPSDTSSPSKPPSKPQAAPPAAAVEKEEATRDSLPCMSGISRNDAWDAGATLSDSDIGSLCPLASSKLSCTKGPGGILSISVGPPPQEEFNFNNSTSLPFTPAGAQSQSMFNDTMSSPCAVKGSGFTWVKGEVLGSGTLGTVYKALDQRTGQLFAVKEVRIDRKCDSDLKFQKDLENEISIYKELSHPHIVSYHGHDEIDSSLYIYLEYMAGGSVAQVLSQFGPLDEGLVATYMRELLEGLEYLHTRSPIVMHRDVKGANILVGLDCKVKLSDFGCSKRTSDTLASTLRGSIPWMAPEVVNQSGAGRRSDIWSLGCVAIEMATAKHPWGSFDNIMVAMMRIGMSDSTPPVPDTLTVVCRDFIGKCTQRDKNLRPHASELLKHEFVCNDVLVATISA